MEVGGKKKPLRRGGWVVHNKRKGVSPERSGGHQFCHFLSYTQKKIIEKYKLYARKNKKRYYRYFYI